MRRIGKQKSQIQPTRHWIRSWANTRPCSNQTSFRWANQSTNVYYHVVDLIDIYELRSETFRAFPFHEMRPKLDALSWTFWWRSLSPIQLRTWVSVKQAQHLLLSAKFISVMWYLERDERGRVRARLYRLHWILQWERERNRYHCWTRLARSPGVHSHR